MGYNSVLFDSVSVEGLFSVYYFQCVPGSLLPSKHNSKSDFGLLKVLCVTDGFVEAILGPEFSLLKILAFFYS